jgi:CRISPR-associated protein Csd1
MLLERLRQYADRLDLPPPMYQKTPIRWLIDLDGEGNLIGFVPTTAEGGKGKNDRGKEYEAPYVARSSGVRAKLLADTGKYVLGLAGEKDKQERIDECHQAFVEQVKACAAATGEVSVQAVLQFLETLNLSKLSLPKDFNPAHNLTFRVDGALPMHLQTVQNYWASVAGGGDRDEAESTGGLMQCLICGQLRPAVKRLQFKIKRIPGGQSSGMALISANAPAFESYGLEASRIAPTCQDCGERFSKAANVLIEGEDTHITVGPLVYLFWTREEMPFSVAALLSHPEPDEVRALIASVFSGQQAATGLETAPFYATAFSASGGRVVVRDWLDTTVANTRQNLARYFALQQIVERDGAVGAPYGLFPLAAATVRDANRELPPNVPQVLLHMALKGSPLPLWLLFQAVKRNRAEQRITRPRAALIKMVLLSQRGTLTKEDTMTQLEPENRDPAYLCGRLLAVLEAVQQAAIPGTNATITDRFFGTASSAPASVFGRLIRGGMAHLGKLRREKPGTYEALRRKLAEVQEHLATFPKTLTLEQQGLFGLGYFHQQAADRAAAIAYRQSRDERKNDSDAGSAA